ncbi:MAG TPA: carbohydrate kinase family protein [Propionibacteriaceae bacterium]|nr:carbohydrate kinase family protein [Propionibacteriaceae bacterium]
MSDEHRSGAPTQLQVVGQLCVDLRPVLGTTGVAAPGELAVVGPMAITLGGAVGNCGRVLADLGVDASLSGCIGDDELGAMARRLLEARHRDVDLVVSRDLATSYSLVVEPVGVDRSFWHHPGANTAFTGDCDVTATRLLHYGYPSLTPAMCADGGTPIVRLFDRAHAQGVATSLDLSFVAEGSPVRDVDWVALLRLALPASDVFCPSWDDLVSCLRLQADPDDAYVAEWADRFIAWGAAVVLVTLGGRGTYLRVAEASRLAPFAACGMDVAAWAGTTLWQVPEPLASVTTTNGAGDAYKAAFLSRLVQGDGPQACLSFAGDVVARYLTGRPLVD